MGWPRCRHVEAGGASSVRRYEKHARIGAQLQKLPEPTRILADNAVKLVRIYFEKNFGKN